MGVAELTVALHYVFDTPTDRLGWDTGHQAYIHKILTGRRPFGGDEATAQEIAHETCEVDPAKPSTAVRRETGIRRRRLAGEAARLEKAAKKARRRAKKLLAG